MRIESVDAYYLAMPDIRDIGDGSQDMLLVRAQVDDAVGWGECEASPLVTLAAMVTPPSHSACRGVLESVLGERLDSPADIVRIASRVARRSSDLPQADHAWAGVEIALWDALGKALGRSARDLLGLRGAPTAWRPYASSLFGQDPEETERKARAARAAGFTAAKFGWGGFGTGSLELDQEHVRAARRGLGDSAALMIDAGTVFGEDVAAAAARLPVLEECRVVWFEEPFVGGALDAHAALAKRSGPVSIAGGEGARDALEAINLMRHGDLGHVQVDTGRIGGIAPARRVALAARDMGRGYVNHTFTSHLALAASLHAFADFPDGCLAEYPVELSPLARALVRAPITPGADGLIRLPTGPGLGMELDLEAVRPYLRDVDIGVGGDAVYSSGPLIA